MCELREQKAEIRRQIRQQRASLSPEWVASRSRQVSGQFIELDEYQKAGTVCLYMALPHEVSLTSVMEQAWSHGRRVLVPAYSEADDSYAFKEVSPGTTFATGPWGVAEPVVEEWAEIGSAACFAVPGVAFSDGGGRVGHGKGYYDRLLAYTVGVEGYARIGVCFDFQRLPAVPVDAWDIGMDMVVSESGVTHGVAPVDSGACV
jgi:5-formyltetrahydrofolate cyclo-ligase